MSGDTKEALARIMKENGVECYGVCPYDELRGRELSCRAAERIPKGVRSCIVMLFPYRVETTRGNVSAYAAVKDYHKVAGKRLDTISGCLRKEFARNAFEWFCDNSPVPEVWAAVQEVNRERALISANNALPKPFLFTGKLICADCKAPLQGNRETRCRKNGTSKLYVSYFCSHYTSSGHCVCSRHTIYEMTLAELVMGEIRSHAEKLELDEAAEARIRNGMAIPCRDDVGDKALLQRQGMPLALARRSETPQGPCWTVLRGLWN